MATEPPSHDPLNIWQNQPTEPTNMNLEEIRRKVRELQHKVQRKQLLNAASVLVMCGLCVWGIVASYFTWQRVGFALAAIWMLLTLLPWLRKKGPIGPGEEAGSSTGIEFCRSELELRRNQLRRPWRWFLGPILLGIGTFLLAPLAAVIRHPGMAVNMLPFLVLLAFWVLFFFRQMSKELREIQRDIDELNALR